MKRFSITLIATVALFFSIPAVTPVHAQGVLDLIGAFSGAPSENKQSVTYIEGDKDATDEILLIRIHGVISEPDDGDSNMPFEIKKSMIERVKKEIDTAIERPQIKAVLLEVDSPGGEITASDILQHQLSRIKAAKKPLVTLIGSLGASGGYYVACAADQIWAHPTSIIGSIGVIMHSMNFEKLAGMIGVKAVTIISDRTPKKDIFSPFREMTQEEKTMLLSIVDSSYDRFIEIVAAARKKSVKEITVLADGGIYTSKQALDKGLIDGIGYREDVMAKLREIAGMKTSQLVRRKAKRSFGELLGDLAEMQSGAPALLNRLETLMQNSGTAKILFQMPGIGESHP
ncbi:MAG: signal peptide peptidase SppA [Candidatus Riflebacteria bacterium]|nr:signal peptide peptidase SppA [Candidatus Riflebacteria bacterium]